MRLIAEQFLALIMLALASPLLGIVAAALVLETGRPVFFRQQRVGLHGKRFWLLKFRTMVLGHPGGDITASGDPRITKVGAVLRRYKVDELPQLWNIVRGEMQLVGPRPEVPQYMDLNSGLWQAVLGVRPGITGFATLVYREEERLLAGSGNPEQAYRTSILPDKLCLSARYEERRSLRADAMLLALTLRYSVFPSQFDAQAVRRRF